MSLTRSICQELCDYVQSKPSGVLGQKFFDLRTVFQAEVSIKSDKFDSRIVALSKFRIFLLHGKTPSSLKIDRSFHILTLRTIHIIHDDEVAISIDEGTSRRRIVFRGNPSLTVVTHFLSAIKHYFPDISPVLRNTVDLEPKQLYKTFDEIRIEVAPRPCHSFRRTYAAMCDYFDQPYREEVSWDVEKIYTMNKVHELRIEDFSHLLPKDLLPIVGVLQYSAYFTGLSADGLKLPPDIVDVILCVIRRSPWLTHLRLVSCGLPKDFITLLASAIQVNMSLPLEVLDLSRNAFDDKKGFHALSACMPRLVGLREVRIAECSLTDKCCGLLAAALYGSLSPNRSASSMQLSHLCLAKNNLNGDPSSLVNLVSLCNSLRVLDVTDTMLPLEKLWPALKYGGLQMEKLILSGCTIGSKKITSEHAQTVKEFFAMAVGLTEIDFSNTPLPPELLKAILLGLACNQQLKPFSLILNNAVEKGGASVLETGLPGVAARSLSLRDNNFESEFHGVVSAFSGMTELRRLDIGGSNLSALRRSTKQVHGTQVHKTLIELVKLIGEDGHLEELVLSDARLGQHLTSLVNTLGATPCLRVLDLSSNEMGNFGARILSKALQLNVSLRVLLIDGNHIAPEGFEDLAAALQMNHTLVVLPYPVLDVSECMVRSDKTRVLTALSQIEASIERNNSPLAPHSANFKRAVFTLNQLSDGMSWDSASSADGLLRSTDDSPMPLKVRSDVASFSDELRNLMKTQIRQLLDHFGDEIASTAVNETEKLAGDRLLEVLMRDVGSVYAEWKWRAACSASETALRAGAGFGSTSGTGSVTGSSHGGISPSSAIASPRIQPRQDGHRPRSVVGDLTLSNEEQGISLDAPPRPSALVHLSKGRPRPQRRVAALSKERNLSIPSDDMTRSTCDAVFETDEDEKRDDSGEETNKKPLSERPTYRAAMLPEASLIAAAAQLKPANERVLGSPKLSDKFEHRSGDFSKPAISPTEESPPPLPRRNKIGDCSSPTTPPVLPPKPSDSRFAFGSTKLSPTVAPRHDFVDKPNFRAGPAPSPQIPPPPLVDDENANNRRSVADMARLFNR